MIKTVKFNNFRNVEGLFDFSKNRINYIFGTNNSGKTNVLEGIKLAFDTLNSNYFRIRQSDFKDSDDSLVIEIDVDLEQNSIPSLFYYDGNEQKCGFNIKIYKLHSGKYAKKILMGNGQPVDTEILGADTCLPNVSMLPIIRTEDIYDNGLVVGISKFVNSEEKYKNLVRDSKNKIKEDIKDGVATFKEFCLKFDQDLDIDFSEPRLSDEKAYVVEKGEKAHNYRIGSGYKSVANIILNVQNNKHNILLIDEIENHIHPSVIRRLLNELEVLNNVDIIATTHSPILINEVDIYKLISSDGTRFDDLPAEIVNKLNIFLHSERAEIFFSENIILVEGYTEEMLLENYARKHNYNWTIINVAGVMFAPYIEIAHRLSKKVIVVSDDDISLSPVLQTSVRFNNLKRLCNQYDIKLIETYNTLESDLYENNYLNAEFENMLEPSKLHNDIMVAKNNNKTKIAMSLIEKNADLSNWHVIEEICNEFDCD